MKVWANMASFLPVAATFKITQSHCFVLAAGCFLWALLIFGLWHLIVS
jgi:hypothetical protein